MDRPLNLWTRLTLRLALTLLAIGVLPAIIVQYVFGGFDALIPAMLLLTVAPLGALALFVALILFLAGLLRRRPRPPS
jgi:polyferredoxin